MSEKLDKKAQRALQRESEFLKKQKQQEYSKEIPILSKKALKAKQLEFEEKCALSTTRMRCCEDVIARIKHQSSIDASLFTICHWDRILKEIQETSFYDFFGHIDYADIPLHRIRYIKYYDLIVWHREQKIDAIFGSCGVPLPTPKYRTTWNFEDTIDFNSLPKQINTLDDILPYTAILAYRQAIRLTREEAIRQQNAAKEKQKIIKAKEARIMEPIFRYVNIKQKDYEEQNDVDNSDSDNDSNSTDGSIEEDKDDSLDSCDTEEHSNHHIEHKQNITDEDDDSSPWSNVSPSSAVIMSPTSTPVTKTTSISVSVSVPQRTYTNSSTTNRTQHKSNIRPNTFVSFRIKDTNIITNIQQVQQTLEQNNIYMKHCNLSTNEIHMTLCLLTLTNNAEKQLASRVFQEAITAINTKIQEWKKQYQPDTPITDSTVTSSDSANSSPASISFSGLSTFNSQVLYTDVSSAAIPLFMFIHDYLIQQFMKVGLHVCEVDSDFTPHVTICKLSKLKQYIRKEHRTQQKQRYQHENQKQRIKSHKHDKHLDDSDFTITTNSREQKRDRTRNKGFNKARDHKRLLQMNIENTITEYESTYFIQDEHDIADSDQEFDSEEEESKPPSSIDSSWYTSYKQQLFGTQELCSLDLCSMRERERDGYYRILSQIQLK